MEKTIEFYAAMQAEALRRALGISVDEWEEIDRASKQLSYEEFAAWMMKRISLPS